MKNIDNEIKKISDSNCKVGKITPTPEIQKLDEQAVVIEFLYFWSRSDFSNFTIAI